jgi:hypothetical protein
MRLGYSIRHAYRYAALFFLQTRVVRGYALSLRSWLEKFPLPCRKRLSPCSVSDFSHSAAGVAIEESPWTSRSIFPNVRICYSFF